jgi:hypothetical protein
MVKFLIEETYSLKYNRSKDYSIEELDTWTFSAIGRQGVEWQ